MRDGDTIVALSSGALPAGVAVIRVSGPRAGALLAELAGGIPEPRRMTLAEIRDDDRGIDTGLVAWFPAPRSFTGEDCAELQVHGSRPVVRALLRALSSRDGVRLAEAGEFTRRAFENGRLDLTAVEGLGDLINAETEAQHRQALDRAGGGLYRRIEAWREGLLDLRAEIEARLDFSEEGDVSAVVPESVSIGIATLRRDLLAAVASYEGGRIVRDGLRVALAGPVNAGKSSLFNVLLKSDLAIVSDEPGTTRDVREAALELDGQLVTLIDMAGLRETDGKAEAEGIRRAHAEITAADLVLWITAPDSAVAAPPATPAPVWRVASKADLGVDRGDCEFSVSALTDEGIAGLLGGIVSFAAALIGHEPALISRERDRVALEQAVAALEDAATELDELELAADSLRRAGDALGRLIGATDAEMVLDRLFSGFCIGK